jgi:hypothetical protein
MAQVILGPVALAPNGSTGNNTHTGVSLDAAIEAAGIHFVVEAAGATPTVTFKVQGCLDDATVTDANAAWQDLAYLPAGTDTVATATQTVIAPGTTVEFFDLASGARFYRRYRVVTTANTNITYHATLFGRSYS